MQPTLTLRNEPDVFVNLARKIYDESITNHERIAEAITSEIRKIRLHAISTVYICSSRNKTVLSNKRLKQIQHHQNDDDIDFKKIIVKILGTLADRDKDSISYIYQQSTDEIRCQELFKENIICKLIDLLENIYLSEQTKIHICTIINNYLEHSSSKALNESQLQIFAHVLNNLLYNFELKLEALRSIILTAVKNRHLPDFIIQTLIKNIDKDDNKLNSLAIIALDIVSQRQIIPNVDKLSTKLLVDWIIVNEGAGITCEKMSSDNVDCQSISSLAAEIFVNTLKNNVMINNRTLEHLTKALNSNHKQTCILSAKALYLASETHELGNDVLIELKEHIENKINDVIVYSTVAYTRGLVKLSSNEGSIMKSHMECLPKIYVFDDLQLDEETFADTVNNNILSVLLNVSKHNLFDDHMFVIFNHILSFESCNQVVAIKILYNYSANKYSIPQDTILALENAIDIPEISHEATKVLSNVIKNRQLINEKFLRHLTDNLYLSNDDQLRKESFELLDIANDNQDISDEFFYLLELERAINLAGNTICDETMKNDINVLLNISKLDNSQQCKMKLLRLKYKSNDELLEALAKFSKPKLFQQNFDQLNNIINNSSELNEKVLKILLECSNKDKITDTLLYGIIFLMNSTNSKEMRSLCRDLIIETIRAGKIVSNKIISCIVTQNDVLKLIAKKQPIPEKFQHHLNLFSRIVITDNIDLKDFSEFLENIRHEFNQDYKLSDLSMSKLLSIQITNNDYDICMKELLIFDLLERFTLNQIEQFDFYKTWLEIEEYTGFQQDQSDILLKLLHRIQLNNMISFNQCNELIRILKNIDFESIYNILSNSSNPYEDILKKFFKDLIFERLSNKEINKKYIDNLVRKMIIKFSFDISKKLLNTIYGEVAQFQFDTLRTEYSQLN
ncbi:unnamed protein product, partial [Rotaria sp. Silwood1]